MADLILSLRNESDARGTSLLDIDAESSFTKFGAEVASTRAELASNAAQQIQVCAADLLDTIPGFIEDRDCVMRAILSRVHALAKAIQVIVGESDSCEAINRASEVIAHG